MGVSGVCLITTNFLKSDVLLNTPVSWRVTICSSPIIKKKKFSTKSRKRSIFGMLMEKRAPLSSYFVVG